MSQKEEDIEVGVKEGVKGMKEKGRRRGGIVGTAGTSAVFCSLFLFSRCFLF